MTDCKTKVSFRTEKDALFSLEKIKTTSKRKVIPIRAYLCSCGLWHLTSKKDRYESVKMIESLKEEVKKLEEENKQLLLTIRDLVNRNRKEDNLQLKKDERVKQMQSSIDSLKRTNLLIRKERDVLINKILVLQAKIQDSEK